MIGWADRPPWTANRPGATRRTLVTGELEAGLLGGPIWPPSLMNGYSAT